MKRCLIVFSIYLLFSACNVTKNIKSSDYAEYIPIENIKDYKSISKDSIKLVAKGKRISMIFRSTKKKLDGYYKFESVVDSSCYERYPRICSTDEDKYYCTDTYFVHLNKGKLDGDWFGVSYAIKKEGIIMLKYRLFYKHKMGKLIFKGDDFNTFEIDRRNYYYYCEELNNKPAEHNYHHIGWHNKYIYPEYLIK